MSDYIKTARDPYWACKLPENLDQSVWHYMDFWKFKYLVEKKALFMCRADKLQDKYEGCYSNRQTIYFHDWLSSLEPKALFEDIEEKEEMRKRVFVHCWCMSDCDYDLMWKAYAPTRPSVAIRSNIRALVQICDHDDVHQPLDVCVVSYFDQAGGEFIDHGHLSPFLHKDKHFRLDTELRILHWPTITDPIPDHIDLPVQLDQLITSVVLAPGSSKDDLLQVQALLHEPSLQKIPIEFSRDDLRTPSG